MLKEVAGDEQPYVIDFNFVTFVIDFNFVTLWLRAYDLPLKCINENTAKVVANQVGELVVVDWQETEIGQDSYVFRQK